MGRAIIAWMARITGAAHFSAKGSLSARGRVIRARIMEMAKTLVPTLPATESHPHPSSGRASLATFDSVVPMIVVVVCALYGTVRYWLNRSR